MKNNIIQIKTFEFGVRIIALHQHLHNKYDSGIAKQVLHSGTSIGANVHEAVEAQSKKDFIHKMSIALKESRETCYWLSLLKTSNISGIDIDELLVQLDEIIRILISIIKTSKFNLNK